MTSRTSIQKHNMATSLLFLAVVIWSYYYSSVNKLTDQPLDMLFQPSTTFTEGIFMQYSIHIPVPLHIVLSFNQLMVHLPFL